MTRPCGGMSHARIGGGRRPPRCRGERPVLPCPIGRRLSGFVSVWARSIFSSSCVVVRAWCLVSAALLRAAARGGRARCVRFEVRRACACCCPVAAADAAAVRAQRLSRCLACWPGAVRAWRLRARALGAKRGGSSCFSCKQGTAPRREQRARAPPVPVLEIPFMSPQAVVAVAAAESPLC